MPAGLEYRLVIGAIAYRYAGLGLQVVLRDKLLELFQLAPGLVVDIVVIYQGAVQVKNDCCLFMLPL
jgi:hypothetical protein